MGLDIDTHANYQRLCGLHTHTHSYNAGRTNLVACRVVSYLYAYLLLQFYRRFRCAVILP